MKNIAVLGCGPAGLLAVHAAALLGHDARIFSRKRQSPLYGCQYLHAAIPGITELPRKVRYTLVGGTSQEYKRKVYPEANVVDSVSPDDLLGDHLAYDIRDAYQKLWETYSINIHDMEIESEAQVVRDAQLSKFDMVISTIPRKVWQRPGDTFTSAKVWAIGDAPDLGQKAPFTLAEDFQVLCDASTDVSWYRLSRVFDHTTIEWPHNKKPPIPGVVEVTKPLQCNSSGAKDFVHLGRYGEWKKGVLTTDVYYRTLELLAV